MDKREDILDLVVDGGVGIELGVAEGDFSYNLLCKNKLSFLYSVDMYAGDRGHNVIEYKKALKKLIPFSGKNFLICLRFDAALELFQDEFFDFIYIDGYAHTGQESGQTLKDWYPKLKKGGIFSGDDYSTRWPKVVKEVDEFSDQVGRDLKVLEFPASGRFSKYPSWYIRK